MNPIDEAMLQVIHCLKKQTNAEKVEVLSPQSKEHNYVVNNEYIYFLPYPSHHIEEMKTGFAISMNEIFGIVRSKQYIYIYCYEDVLFLISLENSRLNIWIPDRKTRKEIYMISYSLRINTVWYKLKKLFRRKRY